MMQRGSFTLTGALRTLVRRGALFVLGALMAVTLVLSPAMARPANAQGITDLLSLGGSFTNGLSSCAIETVGWVICPTMRSIAKLADYGFSYINQSFMRIDYNLAANDSGTYKAWDIMRLVANALFVVAFMVLIYSQISGRNSGGYNIKRLLPRLIVAAIAVNISYYICVLFIDFSNILGDSILAVLTGISERVGTSIMPIDSRSTGFRDGTLSVITSSVMTKPGVAWVLLAPLAAVTISVATVCAAALVLLIMRKTVVAMLILASPILFVAYLLPNLERFFFQGARLFAQLLLLYPIMALLLGAGQIVSATIVSVGSNDANYRVSGDSYFSRNGGSGSAITDMTAAAAAVLPLLAVWFLFKNMSSIMSTAGSRLSASIRGRRGDDDKNARVTGKATVGAANANKLNGIGNLGGRRQAFSRNRRRSSLGGSALPSDGEPRAAMNRNSSESSAQQKALDAAGRAGEEASEDAAKRLEDLQNARINGQAEGMDVDPAAAAAAALATGDAKDKDKHVTAKDMFNNLNQGHDSKDKDRKLSAGPAPAGGGNQQSTGGGTAQPSAPTVSYRAPSMAQSNNIVSGSAPAQPAKIVAVPVQVDPSALLGNQNHHQPPNMVTQPPISGTEEKAKARAQKYLYETEKDLQPADDKRDIFGRNETPTEQPHTTVKHEDENKGSKQ
jgi:hypothetical protein